MICSCACKPPFLPPMHVSAFLSRSGYLFAFLATLVWSGNFVVARGLNEVFSPISISFFRWGIASVVIFPLAFANLKRDYHLLRTQWKLVVAMALISITVFNTLIYQAARTTPALNLSLIAITAPLYVVLLNRILFKEKLTRKQTLGMAVLFSGLALLISKGNVSALLHLQFSHGDLLMALAAALFGVYTVMLVHKKGGNFSFVAATIIIGELMLVPLFIGEQYLVGQPLKFSTSSVLQLLYIGIGPSIISFYLWNKSIASIGSTKASVIYNTIPLFAAVLAFLFLGEGIIPIQIISSIIIVAGVLLVLRSKKIEQNNSKKV
jgi:drug/metabolite transporter (DMT)-like permease